VCNLEEERANARFVREIVVAAEEGRHAICVPASAGAERLPGGSTAESFGVYQSRLEQLGLAHAEILLPQMRIGMGFIG
jgi:anti-sigma factor RsiW